MPQNDPLLLRVGLILLGGGLASAIIAVVTFIQGQIAQATKLRFEVFQAKIVPAYWKSHPSNDDWTQYVHDNKLMNSVLNYGLVLEFSISSLVDQDMVITGVCVVEPGLSRSRSFMDACEIACHQAGKNFSQHQTPSGASYLYNEAWDHIFWEYEGYFDAIKGDKLSGTGFYLVPAHGAFPIAYITYRSFFAERPLKELPTSVLIEVSVGTRLITEKVSLEKIPRKPYMGSLLEFEKYGVEIPTKPKG